MFIIGILKVIGSLLLIKLRIVHWSVTQQLRK